MHLNNAVKFFYCKHEIPLVNLSCISAEPDLFRQSLLRILCFVSNITCDIYAEWTSPQIWKTDRLKQPEVLNEKIQEQHLIAREINYVKAQHTATQVKTYDTLPQVYRSCRLQNDNKNKKLILTKSPTPRTIRKYSTTITISHASRPGALYSVSTIFMNTSSSSNSRLTGDCSIHYNSVIR